MDSATHRVAVSAYASSAIPVLNRKTRVSLVANSFDAGGAERHTITLAQRLDASRFTCEFVPLKAQGALAGDHGVPIWSPAATRGVDIQAVRRLARHWQDKGIEVVIATNDYASILTYLATRLISHPPRLVSVFHTSPSYFGPGLKDRARLTLFSWVLRRYDSLVFVGNQQRREWASYGLARNVETTCIQNGIDVTRFGAAQTSVNRNSFGWRDDDFIVGVCAQLRREKRVQDLILAVSIVIEQGIPIRLLVIGDGPERPRLEALAKQLLPKGAAAFTGFQADVAPLVHTCDVMALVSDVEAFSMSVLESMASGKAVILTDVGGAREQIESGVHGYIVPTRSPRAIADRLNDLRHTGQANAMGARARMRAAELFSEEAMLRGYEDLLQNLQNRGNRPKT